MKKESREFDRQPAPFRQRLEEMKGVKTEIHEALKEVKVKEEKKSEIKLRSILKENIRNMLRAGALPFSLKLKKAHSLGDFYGKFHPSKSKKGLKRSER